LGTTGAVVSDISLGTMTFGAEADEATSHAILDRYVELGGTFVDTADVYGQGASESIVGSWLAGRGGGDDLVIATKARFPMGDGPNDAGLSRLHLQRACHASLRRLGVEAIDLYQLHAWDAATPVQETIAALADLVTAGHVRYVGVSNFTGWQLALFAAEARHAGLRLATLQPQYNLLAREIEWELVPACRREGIGMLPWSPLGGGWLTGKYRRDERPSGATRLGEDPDRGLEAYDLRDTERTWLVLDALAAVAGEAGATQAAVALRWVMDRPQVTAPIVGARTVEQLDASLAAVDVTLDPALVERLDAASAPPTPDYPYGFGARTEVAGREVLEAG